MKTLLFLTLILSAACTGDSGGAEKPDVQTLASPADSAPAPPKAERPYSSLMLDTTYTIRAGEGTKSVIYDGVGTVYSMNLEGMSVGEFSVKDLAATRVFQFKPTKGYGWDYDRDVRISSYEEKPVEACFSHGGRVLWVSLHNAEGIVPIRLDKGGFHRSLGADSSKRKTITIKDATGARVDSFPVPLIKTGLTPKVIARTADSKYIIVSNWHSNNVSVLRTDTTRAPYAEVISTIPVSAIPRGIAVDDKRGKTYVAIMGGAYLSVIDNATWKQTGTLPVASNPRHVVLDSAGRLFVSYNKLGQVACVDPVGGKTLFTASTAAQPRTIALSRNGKFLFVTCYSGNTVEVLRVDADRFTKVASIPCKGKPVGVDLVEGDATLQAWVCNYTGGNINVYSFRKD